MPRIHCHYNDCVIPDEGYCSAAAIEIDHDNGCITHSPSENVIIEGIGIKKKISKNGKKT